MAKRNAPKHPKIKRLARAFKVPFWGGIGLMECIWHWVGQYRPTGFLAEDDIEELAEYLCVKPATLLPRLIEFKLLDVLEDGYYIHDWHEHADDMTRKTLERSGKNFHFGHMARRRKGTDSDSNVATNSRHDRENVETDSRNCLENVVPTYPILSHPILSKPIQSSYLDGKRIANASDCYSKGNATAMRPQWHTDTDTDRDPDKKSLFIDRWNEFFDLYPKRAGDLSKSKGMKAFQSACKTTDPETIINGVKRYKAFCDATGKTGTEFVKQIPSWINAKGWDEAWDVPSQTISPYRGHKEQVNGTQVFNELIEELRGGLK